MPADILRFPWAMHQQCGCIEQLQAFGAIVSSVFSPGLAPQQSIGELRLAMNAFGAWSGRFGAVPFGGGPPCLNMDTPNPNSSRSRGNKIRLDALCKAASSCRPCSANINSKRIHAIFARENQNSIPRHTHFISLRAGGGSGWWGGGVRQNRRCTESENRKSK